ncbi:MAG: tRNA (adenosine(37)-N6)-dimethylallyltransferase MiaA [Gemmatimonadales bacterium]
MADPRPLVPVLVGPTAVGKTAVVMALCEELGVTVISADSRQIYRGLDIGTAKPTREQQSIVTHLGIDIVEPGQRYSAGRFAADAAAWLTELPNEDQPIVVGGTGFYVRALADGLFKEPPIDPGRRDQLRDWAKMRDGLGRWAVRLDPGYAGGGRQRAARVIEVALLTGRPLSWWQREARAEGVMRPWYVFLTAPRPVLYRRIEERTRAMLAAGWVDEVEGVLDKGVAAGAPGLDAVGYREIMKYLQGELQRSELLDTIVKSTRRYAKRQETWFRHQLGSDTVLSLDATKHPREVARSILDNWNERGR